MLLPPAAIFDYYYIGCDDDVFACEHERMNFLVCTRFTLAHQHRHRVRVLIKHKQDSLRSWLWLPEQQ